MCSSCLTELHFYCKIKYKQIWWQFFWQFIGYLFCYRLFLAVINYSSNCCIWSSIQSLHSHCSIMILLFIKGCHLCLNPTCNIIQPPWGDVCVIVCIRVVHWWLSAAEGFWDSSQRVFFFQSSSNWPMPAQSNLVHTRSSKGETLVSLALVSALLLCAECILGSALTPPD